MYHLNRKACPALVEGKQKIWGELIKFNDLDQKYGICYTNIDAKVDYDYIEKFHKILKLSRELDEVIAKYSKNI